MADMEPEAQSTVARERPVERSMRFGIDRVVPAFWAGPIATVAAIAVILVARQFVTVSSPGVILLVFVALPGVLGGVRPALISAQTPDVQPMCGMPPSCATPRTTNVH